jgi:antitoxin CptB
MNTQNKARIHWACRRGMKELDILIMPFFEREYDGLTPQEQQAFVTLLDYQDPQLFSWLMNQSQPSNEALQHIVRLIQKRNKEHGPSTV